MKTLWLKFLEWFLAWSVRHRTSSLPQHLRTGIEGETAAFFHLQRLGYVVVEHRWQRKEIKGDLDLVAWKGETLCFVEVKTRTARDAFPAEEMVDHEKRTSLRRMARAYLRRFPEAQRPQTRFDILAVYLLPQGHREFELFENAFGWSEHDQGRWGDRW